MKRMMPCCCLPLGGLMLMLGGCASTAPSVAVNGSQENSDWSIPLGSYDAIRHSKLTQITSKNADKMKVA